MNQPTSSMAKHEILAEAKDASYRLVDLVRALIGRTDDPGQRNIAIHITMKAKEIEYFLPELD